MFVTPRSASLNQNTRAKSKYPWPVCYPTSHSPLISASLVSQPHSSTQVIMHTQCVLHMYIKKYMFQWVRVSLPWTPFWGPLEQWGGGVPGRGPWLVKSAAIMISPKSKMNEMNLLSRTNFIPHRELTVLLEMANSELTFCHISEKLLRDIISAVDTEWMTKQMGFLSNSEEINLSFSEKTFLSDSEVKCWTYDFHGFRWKSNSSYLAMEIDCYFK